MSRAYRIRVKENVRRVVKAHDKVSTQLEILEILPCDQMEELLRAELEQRGFERHGDEMVRKENGVVITVDPATGEVTVSAEMGQKVEVEGEREGYAADQGGQHARATKQALSEQLQKDLEKKVDQERAKLQTQVTDKLEGRLGDVRQELDQAVNRVTAEALKQKAAQLGQIKELTEDPQTGSMTIVLEV